ncbi:MAG: complex I subunit 5 family protein [Spirochaetales bacterium]
MSLLWLPVLVPIFVGALGYFLPRRAYRIVLFLTQIVECVLVTLLFVEVRGVGPIRLVLGSWPSGVGIALSADLLSSTFVALAGWFFLLMLLFNTRKLYMDRLFQFLFVLLEGLLIGLFLSGDLFNIYVLLELSTLVVSVLIMFKRGKQTIYDGMVYLMLNLASMSFMLLGIGLAYRALGTLDLVQMGQRIAAVGNPRSLILPFSFVVTGIGMKSAMFLLYAWLPKAHGAPSAPSIVSAILSGIQVKAGVYLLARLVSIFGAGLELNALFLTLGFATAISGFLLAIVQTKIKLVLAYSTISQIGLIVIGLFSGDPTAYWGSIFHIVNHALAKSLLFLTAGVVIHVYGTKELEEVVGVFRRMPAIAIAMSAGILAIIGTPLFNGSISKYLIQGSLSADPLYWGILFVNLGTTVTFVKFARMLFGRRRGNAASPAPEVSHEVRQPDAFTTTVSLLLGFSCLAGGILAAPLIQLLFQVDVSVTGALALSKFVIFAATLALAVVVVRFVVVGSSLLRRLAGYQLYFTDLILGVFVFFTAVTGYLWIVT